MEPGTINSEIHYDPEVGTKEVAAWMNWTVHTARRRIKVMKQRLGIPMGTRLLKSQVVSYFQLDK